MLLPILFSVIFATQVQGQSSSSSSVGTISTPPATASTYSSSSSPSNATTNCLYYLPCSSYYYLESQCLTYNNLDQQIQCSCTRGIAAQWSSCYSCYITEGDPGNFATYDSTAVGIISCSWALSVLSAASVSSAATASQALTKTSATPASITSAMTGSSVTIATARPTTTSSNAHRAGATRAIHALLASWLLLIVRDFIM